MSAAIYEAEPGSAGVFDFQPAEYIDSSWLGLIGDANLLARTREVARARPALSRHVLEWLCLPAEATWTAEADPTGVALMPPEVLRSAVLRAGACCAHTAARTIVTRDQVQRFAALGGQQLHVFALSQAPRIAASLGIEPMAAAEGEAVFDTLQRAGMEVLAAASRPFPIAMTRRLLLKLPVSWSYGFFSGEPRLTAADARSLLARVLQDDTDANTHYE